MIVIFRLYFTFFEALPYLPVTNGRVKQNRTRKIPPLPIVVMAMRSRTISSPDSGPGDFSSFRSGLFFMSFQEKIYVLLFFPRKDLKTGPPRTAILSNTCRNLTGYDVPLFGTNPAARGISANRQPEKTGAHERAPVCEKQESNLRTPARIDLESITVDHLVILACNIIGLQDSKRL